MSKPHPQSESNQAYAFDDFTLDLARVSLTHQGQEVKLRPKSFETLRYLIENSGRVVTKEELIQAIWPDSFVTDDSLVQCLRDVRRALNDESQRYIKTVPRRGYLFDAKVTPDSAATQSAVYTEQIDRVRIVIEEEKDQKPESTGETTKMAHRVAALPGSRRVRKLLTIASLFALAVIAILVYSSNSNRTKQAEPGPQVRSIAVLPFRPLSGGESSDEYLGLAMADTLITKLSGLGGIIVRPTSAVQRYALPDQDTLSAGREQRVDAVLEGSIQRSGDQVRVTVRLVRVSDGSPLWAHKSDAHYTHFFSIQDAISERVAEALALTLTGEDKKRLAKRYTESIEAHQLYMKGVFLRNQMTEEGLKKSIDCFQKAIDQDPRYALAYAGQASSNSPLAYYGYIPVREAEYKNRALISKALELDDTLAEAHAALAEFKMFIEWDLEGAEREFQRALELNPAEQLSHLLYPDLLLIRSRSDEGVALSKAGLEIDPLSPRSGKALAEIYLGARQYDQAIEQYNKTRELFPNYSMINLGPCYERKGMYEQAIQAYIDWEARSGMNAENIAALRQAYAVEGWQGYWRKRLDLAKIEARLKPSPTHALANLYARVGEKEHALQLLERAYQDREMFLILLTLDPVWDSLRLEPRFQSILKLMRLVP